jgi:hypothetical protein
MRNITSCPEAAASFQNFTPTPLPITSPFLFGAGAEVGSSYQNLF